MSTTDTRPGFRLPWTTDHRVPTAEAANDADATEAQAGTAPSEDAGAGMPFDAAGPVIHDSPEDPVTPSLAAPSDTATTRPDAPAAESSEPVASPPSPHDTPVGAPSSRPRPTRFLADLTKAMQAAAESERAQTLTQFQAEAAAFIEQFRDDAAGRAALYRKQADEDVAGIRDWSKAEMARIREETDRRISGRKGELEAELGRHADRVDRAVKSIEGRFDAYGAEMARFFERLLAIDDPTEFAAIAASLPEPPSLAVDLDADEPATVEAVTDSPAAEPEPLGEAGPAPDAEAEGVDRAEGVALGDAEPSPAGDGEIGTGPRIEVTVETTPADARLETTEAEDGPDAVAEAVAEAPSEPSAESTAAAEAAPVAAPETPTVVEVDPAPIAHYRMASDAAALARLGSLSRSLTAEPVDPRLAALGLTPDFAAAEAEAAVDLTLSGDGSDDTEGVEALDDGALAARIAGLVPDASAPGSATPEHAAPSPSESTTTRIVVVGLVSVASIAGFKRLLSRVPGVHSVSVSSGPDGEFIFTTAHGTEVSVAEAVAAQPGFDARVTESADGVLQVVAHDPETEG